MSAGFVFLGFLIFVGLVFLAIVVVGFLNGDGASNRRRLRDAEITAQNAKAREKIATKALRSISNGAGNPVLEAQIALDSIDQTYTKELN